MQSHPLLRSALLLLVLTAAACGGSVPRPAAGPGGMDPASTVERFLQLAARPDYLEMGWVFGTERGPIIQRDSPQDVERRMFAIARILENEGFAVGRQAPVPGRTGNAVEVSVAVTQRGRPVTVPFTVVRGPGQRWFVEQVQLEAITGRQ